MSSTAFNRNFRNAMRQMPGGVCIITADDGTQRAGLTATSMFSVSMDPPELLISVNRSSSSWPILKNAGKFGVNVLRGDQYGMADRFTGRGGVYGADRYRNEDWLQTSGGVWVARRALASFACDIAKIVERRQHVLIIGSVESVEVHSSPPPLVYWQGQYGTFSPLCQLQDQRTQAATTSFT